MARKNRLTTAPRAEPGPDPDPTRQVRASAHEYPARMFGQTSSAPAHVGEPDNLVLEHLKRIQVDLSGIRAVLGEHTARLGRLEAAIAGLRRDLAQSEEGSAEFSVRIDRLAQRIERIEQRLELTD